MSKRRTKWLSPAASAEAEQRRSSANEAVVVQLRSVYAELFDDGVIRLVAQQSDFDVDAAIAALSTMADDPSLVAAVRRRQRETQQPPQSQHTTPPSPAAAGAWKAQPSVATAGASAGPRRHPTSQSQLQPTTSATLSSWPSPAEAKPSKATPSIGGLSHRNGELRSVPSSPASVGSLSPSLAPAAATTVTRSAPSSPSSALEPSNLHRGVSASSTGSISPSSTSGGVSLTLPSREPPPPYSSSPSSVRVDRRDPSQSFFDTRQDRRAAALSAAQLQPRWSAYSASEEDPLYYLFMVREQHDKLRAESDEKRTAEAPAPSAPTSVDAALDSFPSLSIHSTPDNPKMRVNAAELLELLRTMFEGVDDGLIQTVVASLDCLSIDLHQLNECVTTLTGITADEQPGLGTADGELGDPHFPPSASSNGAAVNGHLSDLEIAKRMAADPRYSPPRPATLRSLPSTSSTSSCSAGGKKPMKVKVDLSKPVYAWAPSTPTDSLISPHLSARWSLDALYNAFPRLDRPLIDDLFAGHDYSWQRTKAQLLALFPGEMIGGDATPLPPLLHPQPRPARHGRPPSPSPDAADAAVDGEGLIADAVLERELGPVLDNHYVGVEVVGGASTATHANRRAAYFRAATEAFMAGKGGMAREYARRGREEEGEMMGAAGAEEAMRVFKAANRDVDCLKRIDLHGQRVREAMCILAFVVRRMKRRGVGEVLVVTGRGRNSAGGKSRLKPAVLHFCQQRRFTTSMYHEAEIKVSWK